MKNNIIDKVFEVIIDKPDTNRHPGEQIVGRVIDKNQEGSYSRYLLVDVEKGTLHEVNTWRFLKMLNHRDQKGLKDQGKKFNY